MPFEPQHLITDSRKFTHGARFLRPRYLCSASKKTEMKQSDKETFRIRVHSEQNTFLSVVAHSSARKNSETMPQRWCNNSRIVNNSVVEKVAVPCRPPQWAMLLWGNCYITSIRWRRSFPARSCSVSIRRKENAKWVVSVLLHYWGRMSCPSQLLLYGRCSSFDGLW